MKQVPKALRPLSLLSLLLLCLTATVSCITESKSDQPDTQYPTATEESTVTPPADTAPKFETAIGGAVNALPAFTASKTTVEYEPYSDGLIYVLWNEKGQRVIEKGNGGGWYYEYHDNGALKKLNYYHNGEVMGWDCELDEHGIAVKALPDEWTLEEYYYDDYFFSFTYGENGKLTQKKLQKSGDFGSAWAFHSHTVDYDENGNAVRTVYHFQQYDYTYENGLLQRITVTDIRNDIIPGYYEVRYRDDGAWQELAPFNNDGNGRFEAGEPTLYIFDDLGGYTIDDRYLDTNGTSRLWSVKKYDVHGREIERTEYVGGSISDRYITEYSESGDITVSYYQPCLNGGTVLSSVEFTSADRRKTASCYYDFNTGKPYSKGETEKDESGIKTSKVYSANEDGELELHRINVYDPHKKDAGEIYYTQSFYEDGEVVRREDQYYDTDGNMITLTDTYDPETDSFYRSEKLIHTTTTGTVYYPFESYRYDTDGKLTEKTVYDPYCKFVYEYGQDGAYTVFAYDENETPLYFEKYSAQGILTERYTYGYEEEKKEKIS